MPCISTGIYGYPNLPAAHVAISTARTYLEDPDTASQVIYVFRLATTFLQESD